METFQQYTVVPFMGPTQESIDLMNNQAKQGWRLAGVVPLGPGNAHLIFETTLPND